MKLINLPVMLAILILSYHQLKAQRVVARCGIYYDYDTGGNRIKRYYDCKANGLGFTYSAVSPANSSENIGGPDVFKIRIYPNPTSQRFNIAFSKPVTGVPYYLSDMKGVVLKSGTINGSVYEEDVSKCPPGTYLITMLIEHKRHSFLLTVIN